MENEVKGAAAFAIPLESAHEHHLKWTGVGAGAVARWHMTLVSGICIGSAKVLKNRPVSMDTNYPYPCATSSRAATLRSHTRRMADKIKIFDYDKTCGYIQKSFYMWLCLNEVNIDFETADWCFPFAWVGESRRTIFIGLLVGSSVLDA